MNFSVGSSACHIAVSQIQKRNELDVELYISEDKDLFTPSSIIRMPSNPMPD